LASVDVDSPAAPRKRSRLPALEFLVDVGDGKHIPIEDTCPDKLREVLTALQEKQSKS
jgi:hypothetical protein